MNKKLLDYVFRVKKIAQIKQPIEVLSIFTGYYLGTYERILASLSDANIPCFEALEIRKRDGDKERFEHDELLMVKLLFGKEDGFDSCSSSVVVGERTDDNGELCSVISEIVYRPITDVLNFFEEMMKVELIYHNASKVIIGFWRLLEDVNENDKELQILPIDTKSIDNFFYVKLSELRTISLIFEHQPYANQYA